MLIRSIEERMLANLRPGKAVILLGARRTGKTFLLKKLAEQFGQNCLFINGEDVSVQETLQRRTKANYESFLEGKNILLIDEAQKIDNIGLILKLMIDSFENLKIVATGSSAFDLTGRLGEPLTGRSTHIKLFPLAEDEYIDRIDFTQINDRLNERLIFGSYPEVFLSESISVKEDYLRDLVNSYLLKDILEFDGIKNSGKIKNLLRLLAFQTGSTVSLNELGTRLGIARNTVERYLELLEKVFVIFRLEGFSRNLRKEISKNSKWYFVDNGIRNAVIADFKRPELRSDTGMLWENYIISERIKSLSNKNIHANLYFWRTYDRQEIDLIEERDGILNAAEFKAGNSKPKIPKLFLETYPDSVFRIITPDNYRQWLVGGETVK